ncbi:MAG: hypothetical protein OXN24_02160 [Candidatus Dadabacteria bacterium]|nr:hypothetical protein [Candidatus Dadabacteria bacterium]
MRDVRTIAATLLVALVAPAFVVGWAGGVSEQIEDVLETLDDYPLEKVVIGRLGNGDDTSWSIGLDQRDDYVVIGVCDYDCDDIDLCANGKCDKDRDALPFVEVDDTRSIEIEVSMYKCDFSFCFYAVVILRN